MDNEGIRRAKKSINAWFHVKKDYEHHNYLKWKELLRKKNTGGYECPGCEMPGGRVQ
jgi:hypothetical protein